MAEESWRRAEDLQGAIAYRLTRKKVKNINFRLGQQGILQVSAPYGFPAKQIDRLVLQRRRWIEKAQGRMGEEAAGRQGDRAALLGASVPLQVMRGTKRQVTAEKGKLIITLAPGDDIQALLDEFRRKQAGAVMERALFLARQRFEAQRISLPPISALTIRPMKSRWGSCNPASRRISLNSHLMKKPFAAVEYVAAHELCHLLERGHGENFYRLLGQVMPDHRQRRALLKRADGGM